MVGATTLIDIFALTRDDLESPLFEVTNKDGDKVEVSIHNVLHAPSLSCNLLSVTALLDVEGNECFFMKDEAHIVAGKQNFEAPRHYGIYLLPFELVNAPREEIALRAHRSTVDEVFKIHVALGHLPLRLMKKGLKEGFILNIE